MRQFMVGFVLAALIVAAAPAAADSIAPVPIPARKPGAPDVPVLEAYIWRPDSYHSGIPPRGLVAADVGRYLAATIDRSTPVHVVDAAVIVASFYDAVEVVPPFVKLLDGKEKTAEDRQRSIAVARIVAAVAAPRDEAFRAVIAGISRLPPDLQDFARLRGLRAIAFFGGALTASEQRYLATQRTQQADLLANEGFLIAPKKTR